MRFVLIGYHISFIVEAPEDITLRQLIEQCDKIVKEWCNCGICSLDSAGFSNRNKTNIKIGYDDIDIICADVPSPIYC